MRNYIELTKPRITILILICAAVGFAFGTAGPTRIATLVHTLLGTALMASGTAALNQWYEAAGDSKMRRTRMRPIPARRIPRERALCFGLFLSVAGFVDLWLGTNRLAALLGLFTLVSYLLIYTPMKQRSPVCTTLGAIPGAMPPLIGFAAASGTSTREAWALFLILFAWQFPHFYSIAWLYREDYARAGIRMLPVVEPDGESTARRILFAALFLLPVALLPRMLGMAGATYAMVALAATLGLLLAAVLFDRQKTAARARRILLATVLYLPIVLLVLLVDRHATT
jgi:protoheme IX farnesyltransferase